MKSIQLSGQSDTSISLMPLVRFLSHLKDWVSERRLHLAGIATILTLYGVVSESVFLEFTGAFLTLICIKPFCSINNF